MEKAKMRLLAGALAVFTAIAGLVAFFTSTDTVTNTFTASTLKIVLKEPSWNDNTVIVPEQKVEKDPYIKNADETPAYVFLRVTVPAEEVLVEKSAGDSDKGKELATQAVPLFRFVNENNEYTTDQLSAAQKVNTEWYLLSQTENKNGSTVESYTYIYAWVGENKDDTMEVLEPGARTGELFNKVIFVNAREDETLPGSTQTISVEALGIQKDYLKSSEETETKAANVWKYLSKSQ